MTQDEMLNMIKSQIFSDDVSGGDKEDNGDMLETASDETRRTE